MISAKTVKHVAMLILGPLVIAAISAVVYLNGGRIVSTDNAYVKAQIIDVSSDISGQVTRVSARDNQRVTKGQLLFEIDDRPYQIALLGAEAQLAEVRSNIASLQQEYLNSDIEIRNADARLEYLGKELERLRSLLARGSVSVSQFDEVEFQWISAQNSRQEKRQSLEVIKARLIDPARPIDEHPLVQRALAQRDSAQLDLSHVKVVAPHDGIAVNVSAHGGENVVAGAPLMSIVDDSLMWLEANFKETDLTHLKVGQSVSVHIDSFPDQHWTAHVESITPATGAEFSLLPAQNSSGNWVKVVQRIKVNIALDNYSGEPALAAGMSAVVDVDTGNKRSLPMIGSL
ncbi:HlyD family secretion protein [Gammaproteobacteria bacterium LSUCC0112]|nr:HlyD family secretion protein [Gammaproteobacteria bacterium LSUCC0112]